MLVAVGKELAANGRVRHPHIVELKATLVDLDRKRVFMVMELCRGGESPLDIFRTLDGMTSALRSVRSRPENDGCRQAGVKAG